MFGAALEAFSIPVGMTYIYAQPEKKREIGKRALHNWWRIQAKEFCVIGGESGHQVFYPAKAKLNKDKEGRNSQPSKHQEKDNTKLCILFLFYI